MLVLSRRKDEKLVFPNLQIEVQVLRVSGNVVRLGVKAPADIRILRDELVEKLEAAVSAVPQTASSRSLRHEMRNRMNTLNVALHLLERQLEAGMLQHADATLQKALAEVARLDEQAAVKALAPSAEAMSHRRRALLVEDDANERELLAGYLRMSGFEVETADDGLQAMQHLSASRPDIMLLDMHLPNMDGPQTISSIRIHPQHQGLKVFAVSGSERSEVGVPVGPGGVDRWFSKPLDPRTLVQEMNRELVNSEQ